MNTETKHTPSAPKDGGPAFPVPMVPMGRPDEFTDVQSGGMSMRDWFAGQALAGWEEDHSRESRAYTDHNGRAHDMARFAYEIADAMLAERQKGQS